MTTEDILFFDMETTGIPDKSAKWDADYIGYPHIVQIAWIYKGEKFNYIIRPEGWEIPEEATAVHGITTEYALEHGAPFAAVIDKFISDCREAGLICGHNIHFDTSIVKANILRELGRAYYDAENVEGALFKGKRIDTMRSSMKWVDARNTWGRLKFPNLSELYSRCFPGEDFPAHDALEDTQAVARCLPVLVEKGLVELKVKDYPEEQANNPISAFVKIADVASDAAKIAADAAKKFGAPTETAKSAPISANNSEDDKLPIQTEKCPETGNLGKISDTVDVLLEQNNF